jgi:hypothetical protein
MALSPPKASSAGLLARHDANRDTAASTVIQAIVTVCTLWIRRIASGLAICSVEAIHDIMHYTPLLRVPQSPAPYTLACGTCGD